MSLALNQDPFSTDISRHIWESRYRYVDGQGNREHAIENTWQRVARALAEAEDGEQELWEQRFYELLADFRFLPGGRILAGAGTAHRVTLFNCFVMGTIADSLDGIFDALKEGALTMQQGGGVGYDFSTLRPRGETAHGSGTIASGPVSFMHIWDAMCATLLSTGARRGAMMATLRCDHPDIEEFVAAKREPGVLRHFNLSVLVGDDFMAALQADAEWPLLFPLGEGEARSGEIVVRAWPGSAAPRPCRVVRRVNARALWDQITRAAYDYAEPGVIFIDRVNRLNNQGYAERLDATNPCGEIPLPPYGACNLGSLNLTRFVRAPFTPAAALDMAALRACAGLATRFLDNVYQISHFPLPQQGDTARASRRLGLGLSGLGDALAMLGIVYGSPQSITIAGEVMAAICHNAYRASVGLAREKGAFPAFRAADYLGGEFVRTLPRDILDGIRQYGIRNSHLAAIAPTGTISLLANNISSGLEPIYDFAYTRHIREASGAIRSAQVEDYAYRLFRQLHGTAALPPALVRVSDIEPTAHLAMQAALQVHVDNAISKTINVPPDYPYQAFRSLYESAYAQGLKGCTAFRPNPVTGELLVSGEEGSQCCGIEREAD
ncbi:MAG: adenosylcobalamin-dependent ribonucleoside-diphosphate reductase [Sulfuricella sp.]|nr:adenosylcobalamin-dependent ribonucleoside-diphosphate reductase [Sulfuricella sp.]